MTLELWNLYRNHTRSRYVRVAPGTKGGWEAIIARATLLRRRRWRVRRFYDRHLREWIVQVLAGDGYGVR